MSVEGPSERTSWRGAFDMCAISARCHAGDAGLVEAGAKAAAAGQKRRVAREVEVLTLIVRNLLDNMDSPPPHDDPPAMFVKSIHRSSMSWRCVLRLRPSSSDLNLEVLLPPKFCSKDTKTFWIQRYENLLHPKDTKTFWIQRYRPYNPQSVRHPPASAISHRKKNGTILVLQSIPPAGWTTAYYRRALRSHHNDNPSNLFQPNHDHVPYPS